MKAMKSVLAAGAAILLTGQSMALADPLRVDAGSLLSVAKIDQRFQSYNVEMAAVIGAKFWKPYAHMSARAEQPAEIGVGRDDKLFEARPPMDLQNHRLRSLAAALGPAYVRVSGTWANTLYFQNDDAPPPAEPPAGFNGVLTRSQWQGVVDFSKAADAKLVTSFAIGPGVRDATGVWLPDQARSLLAFTRSIGGEIFAAEFFNEPNLASHGGGPKGYDVARFAQDEAAFRAVIADAAPKLQIVGPGDVVTGNMTIPGAPTAEDLLSTAPRPHFDIFDYHYYPAVSQRCAPAGMPISASLERALSDSWLAETDIAIASHKALRDRFAPGAPIWVTETAQAACGGSPWAATFYDSFRYLDQMGRLAKQGAAAVFHNTLVSSEYGLIDEQTLAPRPNYWAALLWRQLMGTTVLDAGALRPDFHVYAQCLRDQPGGVALLAINLGGKPNSIDLSTAGAKLYLLNAQASDGNEVLLNGHGLAVGADDRIPTLSPQNIKGKRVRLPAASIAFITLPDAKNPRCRI